MINLLKTSGLPLIYNNLEIQLTGGTQCQGKEITDIGRNRSELLNTNLSCPELFSKQYIKLDIGSQLKRAGLRYDISIIPPNLAGIEYVKTIGHYNDFISKSTSAPEIVNVLHGSLTVILQKARQTKQTLKEKSLLKSFQFNILDFVYIFKLAKGDKLVIPPNWGHVFVNTRQFPAIWGLLRTSKDFKIRRFAPERGASYYFIRKNARQEIVRNPRYKYIPMWKKGNPNILLKEMRISSAKPIFRQAIKTPQLFDWLKQPHKYPWDKLEQIFE